MGPRLWGNLFPSYGFAFRGIADSHVNGSGFVKLI